MGRWVGVDLDGTLAYFYGFKGPFIIGPPVQKIVDRVKILLHEGTEVRIFTARIDSIGLELYRLSSGDHMATVENVVKAIEDWSLAYIGRVLRITDRKDLEMIELWDDQVRRVKLNTGEFTDGDAP